MITPALRRMALSAVLAVMAACATVQVNFPASEVAQSAELLVADAFSTRNMVATRSAASPRGVDSVANPGVRQPMESILDRQAELKPFYDAGAVGIGNDGFLAVRPATGLSPAQAGEAATLVDKDNADRRKLYAAQAKELRVKPADQARIGQIYARTWRDKALSGWWVQDEAGGWTRK